MAAYGFHDFLTDMFSVATGKPTSFDLATQAARAKLEKAAAPTQAAAPQASAPAQPGGLFDRGQQAVDILRQGENPRFPAGMGNPPYDISPTAGNPTMAQMLLHLIHPGTASEAAATNPGLAPTK